MKFHRLEFNPVEKTVLLMLFFLFCVFLPVSAQQISGYQKTGNELSQRLGLLDAIQSGMPVRLVTIESETPLYGDIENFSVVQKLDAFTGLNLIHAPNTVFTDSDNKLEIFYYVRIPDTDTEGWVPAGRTAFRFAENGELRYFVREAIEKVSYGFRTADLGEVRRGDISVIVCNRDNWGYRGTILDIGLKVLGNREGHALRIDYPGGPSEVQIIDSLIIEPFEPILEKIESSYSISAKDGEQRKFLLTYEDDNSILLTSEGDVSEKIESLVQNTQWRYESKAIMPPKFSYPTAKAEEISFIPVTGTCNDSRVRVRSEPNLSGAHAGFLENGDEVVILDRTADKMKIGDMNSYWYRISLNRRGDADPIPSLEGWTYGAFIDPEPVRMGLIDPSYIYESDLILIYEDPLNQYPESFGAVLFGTTDYSTEYIATPDRDLAQGGMMMFDSDIFSFPFTIEDNILCCDVEEGKFGERILSIMLPEGLEIFPMDKGSLNQFLRRNTK